MPKILTISIVIFNQDLEELYRCLDSLGDSVSRALEVGLLNGDVWVYLIQNDDGNVQSAIDDYVAAKRRDIKILVMRGHGNIGFGQGHNLSLEIGLGKYHLIMNADVLVEKETLSDCISWMESHHSTAMVVPSGYDEGGAYLYLAKRYPDLLSLLIRAFKLESKCPRLSERTDRYIYRESMPSTQPANIELASGCFMLVRGVFFRQLSGFDPHYFLYFEDFDLSIRMAGLGSIVQLPTRFVHFGGMAAQKGARHIWMFGCSAVRFFKTHGWKFV